MVLLGSEACSGTLAAMMGSQNVLVISYFLLQIVVGMLMKTMKTDIHSIFYDKQKIYKA